MNNTYLLKLEEKIKAQEETIANFKKEQKASITLFKNQAKTIENLQSSNQNLIAGQERLTQANSQLKDQAKIKDKSLKDLQKENKSLTKQLEQQTDETILQKERNQELTSYKQKVKDLTSTNTSLIEKYSQLEKDYQNLNKSLSQAKEELISQQEKNQVLEEKLLEAQNQAKEANSPPPIEIWEQEKEELLTTFEKTRNEQALEIAELEKENTQLDQDLNKAVDLLESKDKTIEELQKALETLKSHNQEPSETKEIKTFLCSECNQSKPQTELSRIFGSFSFCLVCSKKARKEAQKEKEAKPPVEEFICHLCEKPKTEIPTLMKLDSTLTEYLICQECRPQAKEFNEADLITDDLWIKYPYSSASEILELEFGIKKNHGR